MKVRRKFYFPLAALLCALLSAAAPAAELPAEFMDVGEIRHGMKGYGLTAFAPNKIDRFDVEAMGVLNDYLGPGVDLILVRVEHPLLQDVGIAQGMSGSPVYLNDRLIGAVAYGWSGSRRSMAGITPIRHMYGVYELLDKAPAAKKNKTAGAFRFDFDREPRPAHRLKSITVDREKLPAGIDGLPAGGLTLEPLAAPLLARGFSPKGMAVMREFFGERGFSCMAAGAAAGGGAGESGPTADKVVAGAPFGVQLLRGDMSLGATGTVTYRKGDRLLGFGHPMTGEGAVKLPFASAEVISVLPSYNMSFKFGNLGRTCGTISRDHLPAVAGTFGKAPPMIKITGRVRQLDRNVDRRFNFEAVDDKMYGPFVTSTAISDSILVANTKDAGEQTAELRYRIVLKDGSEIRKREYFSAESVGFYLLSPLRRDLSFIMDNPYKSPGAKAVEYDVILREGLRQISLEGATPHREVYKPGEELKISLRLRPVYGEEYKRTVRVKLPTATEDKLYRVSILNGRMRRSLELLRNPILNQPPDWRRLYQALQINYPTDRLYVTLRELQPGLNIEGEELPGLPPSVFDTIESAARETRLSPVSDVELSAIELPGAGELFGQADFWIRVNEKGR